MVLQTAEVWTANQDDHFISNVIFSSIIWVHNVHLDKQFHCFSHSTTLSPETGRMVLVHDYITLCIISQWTIIMLTESKNHLSIYVVSFSTTTTCWRYKWNVFHCWMHRTVRGQKIPKPLRTDNSHSHQSLNMLKSCLVKHSLKLCLS